jgi:hypothetical protein
MLTSSPPQVRTRSMPDGPKGAELMSSPSLPPYTPSAPAKMTLRERLAAGKASSLSTTPIDPERMSSSSSSSSTSASDASLSARVQRSLTVSDPTCLAGNTSPREGSFDTLSDNDSFTASMDDISIDGDGSTHALLSGFHAHAPPHTHTHAHTYTSVDL